MANITGASLRPIYDRLHDAPEYHPMEADTFADWALEAGDIVTITRDGNSYTSPVHNATTVWKKGQQVKVSSTGQEERENVTKQSQKKYNSSSSLRNSQYQHIYVEDQYKQMRAGLELTASSAFLYVDNKYTQMRSGLDLTSSSAHLYVDNKYSQMTAGLSLTSSTAKLYVDNKYSQMTAGLVLTSSVAKLYVDNKYSQMTAGLNLTSSTAKLYVDNKYSQMTAGLTLSESSARLYARSAENAAEIVARINESTGQSEIQIDAEKVYIGNQKSTTVISGKLNATDVTADYIKGKIASIASVSMQSLVASSIQFSVGGGLYGDPANAIMNLQLYQSGNSYQIWGSKFNGEIVKTSSFSRAVSSWVWGGGNGKINVTALPQNQTKSVSVSIDGQNTITSNGTYTYIVDYENGDGDDVSTGAQKQVTVSIISAADYYNASSYWKKPQDNDGVCTIPNIDVTAAETWFTMNKMSMTRAKTYRSSSGQDSYYGKLYYWDDDVEEYVAASESNAYWYYSQTNRSGTNSVYY